MIWWTLAALLLGIALVVWWEWELSRDAREARREWEAKKRQMMEDDV